MFSQVSVILSMGRGISGPMSSLGGRVSLLPGPLAVCQRREEYVSGGGYVQGGEYQPTPDMGPQEGGYSPSRTPGHEIRSASRRYASYWYAFLDCQSILANSPIAQLH